MTDAKVLKFDFPSGRAVAIEIPTPPPPEPGVAATLAPPPKRRPPRKSACKHVGSPVEVSSGCWSSQQNGTWQCALHGLCAPLAVVDLPNPSAKSCRGCDDWEAAAEPGWARLGLNLVTALGKWEMAGRPTRTQQQIDKLLAICQACPFMGRRKNGETYCGKCGCPVSGQVTTRNKLFLATESCPLNPPRWTAEQS